MWTYTPPQSPWLDVVHQDRDVVVIDKPSGLLSVPGRDPAHHDSAYARVLERWPLSRVVHRLDMDTSGLLVFALRRSAERALHAQFRERQVAKTYEAVVRGRLAPERGAVELPLRREQGRPRSVVDHAHGKAACTHYRVLATTPQGHSRVELRPTTGRSHQLRVHMLALGHPILGDRFYAPETVGPAAPRLLLHARALELRHPYSGEALSLVTEVPF